MTSSGVTAGQDEPTHAVLALRSGIDMRVLSSGGHGPHVVLVPGLGDDATSWQHQLTGLQDQFQVTAIDNRGAGRTRAPAGPITVQDMASDALAALDALQIHQAHLVGNSMGGAIVQHMALTAPNRVSSVTLSGTWCRSDRLFRDVITCWRDSAGHLDRRTFLLSLFTWCIAPSTYQTGVVAHWLDDLADVQDGQTDDEFVRQCNAVLDFDSAEEAPEIRPPALIVYGQHDILVGPRHADELARRLPHARVHAVADTGHCLYLEQPDTYNAVLRTFWAALPAPVPTP